jgi:DNA-binding Lrp family transcriptional regulator
MNEDPTAVLPIFRSSRQFKILSHLLIRAGRSFTIPELVAATGASQPTVWREVEKLRQAGILTSIRMGRTDLVRADESSRFFPELQSLALKLMGPAVLLEESLGELQGVQKAYIVGSWAARYRGEAGPTPRDLDLVVIGDIDPDEIDATTEELGGTFGLPVNSVVVSPDEWDSARSGFLREVKSRPMVPVVERVA